MLIRLNVHQVEQAWESVAPAIGQALPEDLSAQKTPYTKILQSLLTERAHLWAEISPEGEGPRALVLTTFRQDPIMEERQMVIYALVMLQTMKVSEAREALGTLQGFARENSCENIVSYVANPKYARYLQQLGGDLKGAVVLFNS